MSTGCVVQSLVWWKDRFYVCVNPPTVCTISKDQKFVTGAEIFIWSFFLSELHQYHPGQCHLKYILSRLTGRFGSSFCSHIQANSIILTNYILRSWSRLDNEDYVMNDRPKRQLLDQHNDSCLKMEEQPTRTAGFQTIYDEDVMIS